MPKADLFFCTIYERCKTTHVHGVDILRIGVGCIFRKSVAYGTLLFIPGPFPSVLFGLWPQSVQPRCCFDITLLNKVSKLLQRVNYVGVLPLETVHVCMYGFHALFSHQARAQVPPPHPWDNMIL